MQTAWGGDGGSGLSSGKREVCSDGEPCAHNCRRAQGFSRGHCESGSCSTLSNHCGAAQSLPCGWSWWCRGHPTCVAMLAAMCHCFQKGLLQGTVWGSRHSVLVGQGPVMGADILRRCTPWALAPATFSCLGRALACLHPQLFLVMSMS